jgi:hypothetical protein
VHIAIYLRITGADFAPPTTIYTTGPGLSILNKNNTGADPGFQVREGILKKIAPSKNHFGNSYF